MTSSSCQILAKHDAFAGIAMPSRSHSEQSSQSGFVLELKFLEAYMCGAGPLAGLFENVGRRSGTAIEKQFASSSEKWSSNTMCPIATSCRRRST